MNKIDKDKLLQIDGGLSYILHRFPQAVGADRNANQAFKMRDEHTASAKMKEIKGVWCITDFGGDGKARNAIELEMLHSNVEFIVALRTVASFYKFEGVEEVALKPLVSFRDALPEEQEGEYYVEFGEFTESLLTSFIFRETAWKALHREASKRFEAAKALCGLYHLKVLTSYTKIKNGKAVVCTATEDYPIFYIDEGVFGKIYTPKDKECRFRYKGKKPAKFLHGLAQHLRALEDLKTKKLKEDAEDAQEEFEATEEQKEKEKKSMKVKLPLGMLLSGFSDAINAACFDVRVMWGNSESEEIDPVTYTELSKTFYELYQLQDIDEAGMKASHRNAMKYLDLRTIWLPTEMTKRKRDDGKPIYKDFRDWLSWRTDDRSPANGKFQFDELVKGALMYRFWDEQEAVDKKTGKTKFKFGRAVIEYVPSNLRIYNFLYRNGFARMKLLEKEKDGYMYVKVTGNVVKEVNLMQVRDYVYNFLEKINASEDLRNTFYRSPQVSDVSLANLPIIDLDFKLFGPDFQYYIFEKAVWKVTAEGIKEVKNDVGRFVWEDRILKFGRKQADSFYAEKPKILPEPWEIKKDAYGKWKIKILNTDCMFMRFLMQTCRIHWQKELVERLRFFEVFDTEAKQQKYIEQNKLGADELANLEYYSTEENQKAYREQYKFSLDGLLLDAQETEEQYQYFINRIYTIGYLLHRYKFSDRSWIVINMDAQLSEIGESNGRAGKSIQSMALKYFLNVVTLPGRAENLETNPFMFEKVTRNTDLVLIDDVKPNLQFPVFYEPATSEMTVNPKNRSSFSLPYSDSPKFCFNTNFGDSDTSGSSRGRKLVSAFSDYYHEKTERYESAWTPKDDFGRRLFDDFTVEEWNLFYNTMLRCLQFYLAAEEKVNAPMGAVEKRSYMSIMADSFKQWADVYFSVELGRLDKLIPRTEAQEDFKRVSGLKNATSQGFAKRMKAFCDFYGYTYDPFELRNEQGRIIRRIDGYPSPVECIYVQTQKELNV